jgi:hypothetical protein
MNGFVQPDQHLFVSLEVYTNSAPGIDLIAVNGVRPLQIQYTRAGDSAAGGCCCMQILEVKSWLLRPDNANAAARVFVDLSGRLIQP